MTFSRLKETFDNMPDGISIIDSDMRIEWVNKTLHDKGFHCDGIKGKKCYHIYKQRNKICKKCPALKAMLTKKTIRLEERGADGKHYEVTAVPLLIDGKVEKVMEITREIRKKKPFAVSLCSAPGIIAFVVDSKGKFVAVNKDAEKATGYKEGDVAGTSFTRIIKKANVTEFRSAFRRIIKGNQFPSFETAFQTKKGKLMPVEVNCNPFHSDGALLGVEIVARDISQRKEAKKKLRKAPKKKKAAKKLEPEVPKPRNEVSRKKKAPKKRKKTKK